MELIELQENVVGNCDPDTFWRKMVPAAVLKNTKALHILNMFPGSTYFCKAAFYTMNMIPYPSVDKYVRHCAALHK